MKISKALAGPVFLAALSLLLGGCAAGASGLSPVPASGGEAISPGVLAGLEPQERGACAPRNNSQRFNGSPIALGSTIWFTSVISAPAFHRPMEMTMMNSLITFKSGRIHYRIEGPNMRMNLADGREVHDGYRSLRYHWYLDAPYATAGNDLLNAVAYKPPNALPGGITNVTWSAKFYSREAGRLEWRWSAAVYSRLERHYASLAVKAVDDARYPPYNTDPAGTPEAFKQYLLAGGTGEGRRSYTGILGPKVPVTPCP